MNPVYENPWFRVIKNGRYHYIQEENAHNGAAVLLTQGEAVLLINVKRAPFEALQWEIPRGYGEPGETPAMCAVREVYEETGYRITVAQLTPLGQVKPNSALLQSQVSLFHAELCATAIADPIPDQEEGIKRLQGFSLEEIRIALAKGGLTDGFTLSALGAYLLMCREK